MFLRSSKVRTSHVPEHVREPMRTDLGGISEHGSRSGEEVDLAAAGAICAKRLK